MTKPRWPDRIAWEATGRLTRAAQVADGFRITEIRGLSCWDVVVGVRGRSVGVFGFDDREYALDCARRMAVLAGLVENGGKA